MKKLFILFLLAVLYGTQANAQSSPEGFSYQVYYQTTSTDPEVFDSLCTRVCKVTVDDISNLAYIRVKVGTTETAADIVDYGFAFDVTTGLPEGLTWYREENTIYLGLLTTYKADTYFYEVRIEDNTGNLSLPKLWN